MTKPLRIALIGCGNVGAGVVRLLHDNAGQIAARCGRSIEMPIVVVRDPGKSRRCKLPENIVTTQLSAAWEDPDVDIVVELIGGLDDAYEIAVKALQAGKHLVTANKALLARRGVELFKLAHQHNKCVAFEASVAGGIPIIGALTQGMAGNRIVEIEGILNGTSNFILSAMANENRDYATALADAQRLGYAEANPAEDVDGSDAANKLSILVMLAFREIVDPSAISRRGITGITPEHIRAARDMGSRIKLIASAKWKPNQRLHVEVMPASLPLSSFLGSVNGGDNAIRIVGDAVGNLFFAGPGAGMMATASAVVSDLIDVAIGRAPLMFEAMRLWELGE